MKCCFLSRKVVGLQVGIGLSFFVLFSTAAFAQNSPTSIPPVVSDSVPHSSLSSSSSSFSSSAFQMGMASLREGQFEKARTSFELVPLDSAEFLTALIELQKLNYQQGKWDQFFAYAQFYQQKILAHSENWAQFFHPRLIALEVMALVKHCQWQIAAQVGQWGLHIAQEVGFSSVGEIHQALNYLPSLEKLKTIHTHAKLTSIPSSIQNSIRYWPIHSQSLSYVDHPRHLRVKVESRCSK